MFVKKYKNDTVKVASAVEKNVKYCQKVLKQRKFVKSILKAYFNPKCTSKQTFEGEYLFIPFFVMVICKQWWKCIENFFLQL